MRTQTETLKVRELWGWFTSSGNWSPLIRNLEWVEKHIEDQEDEIINVLFATSVA
ncbi:hypothetical protein JOC75_002023 [Metabacillus crassostreae]|uniref:hypothetical protein n=1 Tax=Metabacillus crassostreae TaxID=929098 RepID=UPI00195823E5|nr:hypothetical protein [Metabacillus crassostreae]MBM7604050.1 hypothetical protein [Metabacillus crassostreae]